MAQWLWPPQSFALFSLISYRILICQDESEHLKSLVAVDPALEAPQADTQFAAEGECSRQCIVLPVFPSLGFAVIPYFAVISCFAIISWIRRSA